MPVRGRLQRLYGGTTTPSDSRTSRRGDLSRQLQLDVSNRSADKKSFLIKRSGSKTRTFVEAEEKTLDLLKLPIKRIKVPSNAQTEKKRLTEDMPSMRTVSTAKGLFPQRRSFLKTEPSNLMADTMTVAKKKSQVQLLNEKARLEMWPEKATSLYQRVQTKYAGAVLPERSAPVLEVAVDLDRLVGSRTSEASIFGDFLPVPKVPKRKKGLLKGFVFAKKRPQNKCHVSMAVEDKIKFAAAYQKEQVEFQNFLIQRTLLMLTKVRGKQLENRIGRDRPYNPTCDSPTVSREKFESPENPSEEVVLGLDSEQDEDELVENDYKRFNYVINFKARPSNAAAVFTNLDEAIEGHTQFCLTKSEPLYAYPTEFISALFAKRLGRDYDWIGDGLTAIKFGRLDAFEPDSIKKELEIDLIIRDKRAKKFQAVYIEENGKMNNDNFEALTLWGYQINKLLSRDLEKDLDEFKLGCSIPIELRKLSTALIKNLYVGLEEEMTLPNLLEINQSSSMFRQFLGRDSEPELQQQHLSNLQQIERLVGGSEPLNKEYFLLRFYTAHRHELTMMWEKRVLVGELADRSVTVDEDSQLSADSDGLPVNRSRMTRTAFPFVVVNTIEDKSQLDIDSEIKNSGLPSPINGDDRAHSFKDPSERATIEKQMDLLSGKSYTPRNRHLLKLPLRRHLTPNSLTAKEAAQQASRHQSDSDIKRVNDVPEKGFSKAASPFLNHLRKNGPKLEKPLLPAVLQSLVGDSHQKKFHRNRLANSSNLIFESKLKRTSEATKLFDYIERKETIKFLAMAKSSNLDLCQLRTKDGRSLMHLAAMVGDEQIAGFLHEIHCLGNFKDVNAAD